MDEVLFNWTLLLATFGGLFLVAWIGYRDLQGLGERAGPPDNPIRGQAVRFKPAPADAPVRNPIADPRPAWEHAPSSIGEDVGPESGRLLQIQYVRDGEVQHTEFVSGDRPGFVGTEAMPGMGAGILVRHAQIGFDGYRFTVENRHGSQPLAWQSGEGSPDNPIRGQAVRLEPTPGENAPSQGEIAPREKLALRGDTDLLLGDWVVALRDLGGEGETLDAGALAGVRSS